MKKFSMIVTGLMMFFILLSPSTVIPGTQALTMSGPIPIPGKLFPVPGTGNPIIPSTPNLGKASTAPPVISLYSINQINSGLVASDPLNNETKTQQQLQANPGYWKYNGDAPLLNANYSFFKDTQGLHIGSQSPGNGTYAGFYAETPNTSAILFHSVITTPIRTLPILPVPPFYENGMYIQTSQPSINYVTCVSNTSQWGTIWGVGSVTGNAIQGTTFKTLWFDTSPNQPLTRDCTIITNGNNYLKVYLDGVMVYTNNTLNLQIPGPFNSYLEPQSSYAGQLLNGTYKDYYATTDENIQVTNNPGLAATVKLVSPCNTDTCPVLASANVDSSGKSTLNIGQFHMPLAAYIKVYDSNNIELASTSSAVNIFGGDVYTVNSVLGL